MMEASRSPENKEGIAAFLEKVAEEEAIEEELDLAGWTDALVDELTALYDEDVVRISEMDDVTLLMP